MNFMWNGMNSRAPPAKSSPFLHFSIEIIGVMRGLGIFLHVEKELVRGCSGSILMSLRDTEKSRLHELSQPKISG